MHTTYLIIFMIWIIKCSPNARCETVTLVHEDILAPYKHLHGAYHHHRVVRDCQPAKYNNVTHEVYPAQKSSVPGISVVTPHTFSRKPEYSWPQQFWLGHHFVVNNPHKTVSVLEPVSPGGCGRNDRASALESGRQKKCILAVNAGFFNTTSGACFGDIVSDGREVQNTRGIQNAHFGIKKDGSLFFGYLPDTSHLEADFSQLITGVIWLVRNGEVYISTSEKAECSDIEETGNLDAFIRVQSARLAVGHDTEGRVVVVHVDGKSWERGLDLNDFAKLLISLGVVNAINLDGGGSVTAVLNDTIINYPSDTCNVSGTIFDCARKVSTILCVHEIECMPGDCSGHGDCVEGVCHCHSNWKGSGCEALSCPKQCASHGVCEEGGCACDAGWRGRDCSRTCVAGRYGQNCTGQCRCSHAVQCDHVNGTCFCLPGYTGPHCELECPYGRYGERCEAVCQCEGDCSCHPINGACHQYPLQHHVWEEGHCYGNQKIINKNLMAVKPDQYSFWMATVIATSTVAALSVIMNITLLCLLHYKSNVSKSFWGHSPPRRTYGPAPLSESESSPSQDADVESQEEEDSLLCNNLAPFENKTFKKARRRSRRQRLGELLNFGARRKRATQKRDMPHSLVEEESEL